MNTMDEIVERLNETERRAGEVVSRLERLDAVQRSLADAGQGLAKTNAAVTKVANATKRAVDTLNQAVLSFRKATEAIDAKLAVVDDLASRIEELQKTVGRSDGKTERLIEDAVERLSRQTLADRVLGRYRSGMRASPGPTPRAATRRTPRAGSGQAG